MDNKTEIKKQSEKFNLSSVLAANPLIVNSLPACSFTQGNIGDIFIKNKNCQWSDYKCTLTDYHTCNGWLELGAPAGDACYCYSNARVCAIATDGYGYSFCYSDVIATNGLFASPCEMCVRR